MLIFPFFYIITYLPIGREREIEIVSFELDKACNKFPRKLLWWVLENKGIPLIMDQYIARMIKEVKTKFSTEIGCKICLGML